MNFNNYHLADYEEHIMDELDFYNRQFKIYNRYDHHRIDGEVLDIEKPEDYFEHLVRRYSNNQHTLVDLGCGDGYFTSKLANINHRVIGIEPSELINAAYALLDTKQSNGLQFLKEDAYQLSIADESVDMVISRRGPDPEEEVFRILKQGGMFIFITIGERDCFSLKEIVGRGQHFNATGKVAYALKDKFNDAGFTEVHCKEFCYEDEFSSIESLKAFLHQVPIFDDFSESDYAEIDQYCLKFKKDTVKLNRHRVVLFAKK